MKKILVITILTIVLASFAYVSYYKFIDYKYKPKFTDDYYKIIAGLKNQDELTINSKKQDVDYLSYENIKIANYLENFLLDEREELRNVKRYILADEEGKSQAIFSMGIEDTYLKWSNTSASIYGLTDKTFLSIDPSVVGELGLKDDIALFNYLIKLPDKSSLFSSKKIHQADYYLATYSDIVIPRLDSLTLIKGSYYGYIFNYDNDSKEVSILADDKRYIFNFRGEYFTDELILKMLESIEIE